MNDAYCYQPMHRALIKKCRLLIKFNLTIKSIKEESHIETKNLFKIKAKKLLYKVRIVDLEIEELKLLKKKTI